MPTSYSGSYETWPGLAAEIQTVPAFGMDRSIAGTVLPEITVDTLEPVIELWDRADILALRDTEIPDGGTYPRSKTANNEVTGDIRKYGHEKVITDREAQRIATRPGKSLSDVVRRKSVSNLSHIKLRREYRVAQAIQNETTFTGDLFIDNSGTPLSTANDDDTNYIELIKAAARQFRLNSGMSPNSLVCSETVMERLTGLDDVQARFQNNAVVTESMLRNQMNDIFGIPELVVGPGIYNSANSGQDFDGAEIWDDDYLFLERRAVTSEEAEPCLGRTLRMEARLLGATDDARVIDTTEGIEVASYFETNRDVQIARVREYLDEMFIDLQFGLLMQIES